MKDILALGSALLVLMVFAAWHPTGDFVSSPSYWVDEAVSVEKARNFLAYGKLDVAVAPGVLSGKPYATAAAGPLLTLPLAGFFAIFGAGVAQTRIYMLAWLVLFVIISYFFVRALAGRRAALCAVLLVATFSPLYANGKTATGDIPGFLALLAALYYLYCRKWHVCAGVLFGLAVATKPSLYVPVVLVAAAEILLSDPYARWKHAALVAGGSLLILVPWVFSLVPLPRWSISSWQDMYMFFSNPFPAGAVSVWDANLAEKIPLLFHTTTAHYILLLILAVAAMWYTWRSEEIWVRVLRFSLLYAIIAFVLYLRSPGWLRYLLAGELLLFLVVSVALFRLLAVRNFRAVSSQWLGSVLLAGLAGVQAIHFIFFSWRTSSGIFMEETAYVQQVLRPGETIGFVNAPRTSSLVDPYVRYQVVRISGNTVLGKSPLAYSERNLPTYVYISSESRFENEDTAEFVEPYRETLDNTYQLFHTFSSGVNIYRKNQ